MVNWRLMWYLESHGLLSNRQCGFRRNRSTIDHLVNLESFVREAFLNRQHLLAVFFDIEGAYDTSWRYGILRTIHGWGLRGHMADFITHFMRDRSFRVRVGSSISAPHTLESGVPQGSVLSTTLFAISINPVVETIHPPVASSLFVDDLGAAAAGHSVPSAERRLQLAINKAYESARSIGYRFSPAKTVCMHFTRRRELTPEPSLHLGPDPIPVVDTARFLGITFDRRLTWVPQLKHLRTRCLQGINAIRAIGGTKWGADRTVLFRMYHALVRSRLDYGSFVYGTASTSALRLLDPVHHRGIRLATGAFNTSPIPSLYAESGEPPLDTRRDELFLRYATKLRGMVTHPTYSTVHEPRYEALFANRRTCTPSAAVRYKHLVASLNLTLPPVIPISHGVTPPWLVPRPNCDVTLTALGKQRTSTTVYRREFYLLLSRYSGFSKIYTDGSKKGDTVGCAVVQDDRTIGLRLSGYSSNYTAELMAIRRALQVVSSSPGSYLILTDSLSAMQAINTYFPASPLVVGIQDLIADALRGGSVVVLCWVPGHAGIAGNETADTAASVASRSPVVHLQAVPHLDLNTALRGATRAGWEGRWLATTGNKLREIKSTTRAWPTSFRESRVEETALARLRIGHCQFSHSHLLRGEEGPICACGEDLTVHHLLCVCVLYIEERQRHNLSGDIAEDLGDDRLKVEQVLSFLRETDHLRRL